MRNLKYLWIAGAFIFIIKMLYADPYVDETWLGSGNEWCQFVIIADPHIGAEFSDYGTPGWNDSPPDINNEGYDAAILRGVVNWINTHRISERIRFVIVLGDLTQSAEISELLKAREILNNLEAPWIPLLGNHDVWPYISASNKAPEDLSDSYFHNIFASQYQYLAAVLPNFVKCPVPIWNWEVDPDHNSYFQNFAFDYPTGNKIWHFICLDFNARDDAPNGKGVAGEADLHTLNMDNQTSSIKIYNTDSRGVILYDEANPASYEGRSEVLFDNDPDLRNNYIQNDAASSIRLVGNCTIQLHRDVNYKGSIVKTSTNISDLGASAYQFNDKTSSVKVNNGYLGGHLIVYEDVNYGGKAEIFIASDRYLPENYIGNDKISSFIITGPCKVTFYKDVNFGGAALLYNIASGDH
ncbi:MAG: metallophosphoesterase, partial [bacterium]